MTQTKLTEIQIILLARGAGHADGVMLPLSSTGKAAAAFGAPLGALRRKGLARKDPDGAWRLTESGRLAAAALPQCAEATAAAEPARTTTRPDTKRGQILALLERPEGASMAALVEATGWQAHSIRAVLSGLRKAGVGVSYEKQADSASFYRAGPCRVGQ